MRAIVKAAVQRDLGIALIPVDEKLAFHMTGRVMVSTLPKEFKDAPEGILPAVEHEIANDPRLQAFFQHERVTNACGGVNAIEAWATQFTKCQYKKHDRPSTILDTERVGHSAVRICPGCFTLSAGASPNLLHLAARNTARWVVATAKHRLRSEGQLTIPELLLWAMLSDVFDLIPEEVARTVTDIPEPKVISGTRKESEMDCTPSVNAIISKQAVKCFVVDPEPPKAFMLRPKLTRVEDSKYTRWVKSQKCLGCGARADDPHHIIGHGLGGMGTKPSDYLTIPLCRTCHRNLHDDPAAWEAEHGSQTDLFAQFFDYSVCMGAIS
ncbi:DUF968 domain-containing protein [Serratia entomophila]|uniref:DUF968 domain-containing protein n=1 Tax=Serratia entomophila TaxID=42906 RepID=UPI002179DDE5|nr:DUF968 domain-containing protein [Serratia entomophila]CAI1745950.1 Protein of uncharacterised function (DUF968) [Serratia entomophila]